MILGDRQDVEALIHYSIELLGEHIADGNKQWIIEFMWNLTQINPENPLFVPHANRLLARLTRVSSSMIESDSSISSSLHDSDLLLVLSRRPSNTATTKQLCSIFLRHLFNPQGAPGVGHSRLRAPGEVFVIIADSRCHRRRVPPGISNNWSN